jgi:PAS domain S-box-containing protein
MPVQLMSQAEHLGYGDEALILRTLDGRILDWNKGAEVLYGYAREDAVGKTTHELFSTKFPEALTTINKAVIEEGYWKGTLTRTLRNGKELFLNSRWVADEVKGPDQVILEIDIDKTATVQSDRLIRQKEQVVFQILDSVPDGLFVLSADGTPYFANRKAKEILGKGIDKDGTRSGFAETYSAYVSGTDTPYPEHDLPLVRALQGESVSVGNIEIRRQGKTIELHSAGAPVYDVDGRLVFACAAFSDITDLKDAQRKLTDTNKLLKQSNGELENYNYAVSHDLKTPLRTIKSFSTFLIDDYSKSLDPTALDYLNAIAKAATRMDDLIDGLLTLSRVGRKFDELEDVDLNELVAEIILDIKGRWKAEGDVTVRGKLPLLRTQRVWMKQLMMNLITNGLKYNRSSNPTVEISCSREAAEDLFSFKDNGIGIDPRDQDKLFGLFQRLHTAEEYEGSGIGLATCKKVVENFGGSIWLDSAPGKGTTFFFTVPTTSPDHPWPPGDHDEVKIDVGEAVDPDT